MDPVALVVFVLFVLFSGGASRAVVRQTVARRFALAKQAVLAVYPAQDRDLSVFDLFWDLGANEYALEIMHSRGMLPAVDGAPGDLARVFARIAEEMREHGGYTGFVQDMLEAIDELDDAHRAAGDRRLLPVLEIQGRKLLPAPDGAHREPELKPVNHLLGMGLGDRSRARTQRWGGVYGLRNEPNHGASVLGSDGTLDLDRVDQLNATQVLRAFMQGSFRKGLAAARLGREIRAHQTELNTRLAALYAHVYELWREDEQLFDPLYDLSRRWEREAWRLWWLLDARRWAARPWALVADALVQHAYALALELSRSARANTDEILQSIVKSAERGEEPTAGYLIYLNRHAFFAGRGDAHARLISDIEFATARLRSAVRRAAT